jgi:hypothetical protein
MRLTNIVPDSCDLYSQITPDITRVRRPYSHVPFVPVPSCTFLYVPEPKKKIVEPVWSLWQLRSMIRPGILPAVDRY